MNNSVLSIMIVSFVLAASTAHAQDRGVSIPDAFTPNAADTFVAEEITAALRAAGSEHVAWRVSEANVPLAELMRACGGSLASNPDFSCMSRMVVTRDPTMENGLILYAILQRRGRGGAHLDLTLAIFDMRTNVELSRVSADVERITAPVVRHQLAVAWITELTASLVATVVVPPPVAEPEPDPPAVVAPVVEPEPEPEPVPVVTVAVPLDTTLPDVLGWTFLGTAAASAIGAAITGGMVLTLSEDARFNAYRNSWDATRISNACEAAAGDPTDEGRYALGVCSDGDTYEMLTRVLWVAAGAFAIAGATFLIWHPGASSTEEAATDEIEVRFVPSLGPTFAGTRFDMRF